MAPVCEALLAKLNELMDFLRFARLPSASFRGAVRPSPASFDGEKQASLV